MFDEVLAPNPAIKIELQTVSFDELLTKIIISHIYHIYDLWLADPVNSGTLMAPPNYVIDDVSIDGELPDRTVLPALLILLFYNGILFKALP